MAFYMEKQRHYNEHLVFCYRHRRASRRCQMLRFTTTTRLPSKRPIAAHCTKHIIISCSLSWSASLDLIPTRRSEPWSEGGGVAGSCRVTDLSVRLSSQRKDASRCGRRRTVLHPFIDQAAVFNRTAKCCSRVIRQIRPPNYSTAALHGAWSIHPWTKVYSDVDLQRRLHGQGRVPGLTTSPRNTPSWKWLNRSQSRFLCNNWHHICRPNVSALRPTPLDDNTRRTFTSSWPSIDCVLRQLIDRSLSNMSLATDDNVEICCFK